ncbi:hypothetical protein Ocin01_17471, partial [Orchesella cincta]
SQTSSFVEEPEVSSSSIVRRKFLNMGLSEEVVKLIFASCSGSTWKQLGYSAINTARSALSMLLPLFDGVSIWDADQVVMLIESWPSSEDLDLKILTLKLVSLLALASAQRVQTLSLIKTRNVSINSVGTVITISDLVKTSVVTKKQPKNSATKI